MGFLFKVKSNSSYSYPSSKIRGRIFFAKYKENLVKFYAKFLSQLYLRFDQPKYRGEKSPIDLKNCFFSVLYYFNSDELIHSKLLNNGSKILNINHPEHESLKEALFHDEELKKKIDEKDGAVKYFISNFERICGVEYIPIFEDYYILTHWLGDLNFKIKDMKAKILSRPLTPTTKLGQGIIILILQFCQSNLEEIEKIFRESNDDLNIFCIIVVFYELEDEEDTDENEQTELNSSIDDNGSDDTDAEKLYVPITSIKESEYDGLQQCCDKMRGLAEKYNRKIKIETVESDKNETSHKFEEKLVDRFEDFFIDGII